MTTVSSLPGPALQAARSAVQAALAEHPEANVPASLATSTIVEEKGTGDALEPGEIQEVNMEAQAETIRTVFSDPKNFNVKVSPSVLLSVARAFQPLLQNTAPPLHSSVYI